MSPDRKSHNHFFTHRVISEVLDVYNIPMKRRLFLGGMVVLPFATPTLAKSKPLSLDEISQYLNSLGTAKGAFTQVDPDGKLSKGMLYIKRPGQMRFEYAAPNNTLVIVKQSRIAIFDQRSNAGPQQYPLWKTPLHFLLKRNINLTTSGVITSHQYDGTSTSITAHNPEHPNHGNIKLVFKNSPIELGQWIVTDESGRKTTINLGKLNKEAYIPSRLFDIDLITNKSDKR